jgi:hypothetical protein
MNKRQLKKRNKKCLPVIADEFNLITMTNKEREEAVTDYLMFVRKYAYRKHYKDLKMTGKYLIYAYPVSKSMREAFSKLSSFKRIPRSQSNMTVATQSVDDFITE